MPRLLREIQPFVLASIPFSVFMAGFYFEFFPYNNYVLSLYIASLVAVYATIVHAISAHLEPSKIGGELASIVLFILTAIVLVGGFGLAWEAFDLVKSSNPEETPTKLDAYYFSAVAFFTIGFGDFVPKSPAAKVLLSVEAFMGAAHMVAFFSIVVSRAKPRP